MSNHFVHNTAVVDAGCIVGEGSKIWHFSHLMSSAVIGNNCIIGQNVFLGNKVVLGNHVKVQNNVSLYEGVVCDDYVFLGPSCVFTNVINPRAEVERKSEFKETRVQHGATIGANATVVCGNNLGKYCLVGAGSVVTKSVPDYALVVGNPAKQIAWVSQKGERLSFIDFEAVCPIDQSRYILKDNTVKKLGDE
jgi:UDP-2-acetamido-3-amino-2,3-dideoxy-glucuronate N-acetyltransferase